MRVLEFVAEGQTLKRDPRCDFAGIVSGSKGYLHACFHFCKEWKGCKKVAVFSCKGKDYPVPLDYNMCEIPAEALAGSSVRQLCPGLCGGSPPRFSDHHDRGSIPADRAPLREGRHYDDRRNFR